MEELTFGKKIKMQNPSKDKLRLITVPYSFDKNLFKAYDDIFRIVDKNDWVCFMDADTAFLEMSDFGDVIQAYIDRYPNTGIFTCYATRCHYSRQKRRGVDSGSDSIKYLAEESIKVRKDLHLQVKDISQRIAGHLVVMKKANWLKIREILKSRCVQKKKNILGFDTQLSYSVLEAGMDIKLMRGVMVFHYLRMLTGKNDKIK